MVSLLLFLALQLGVINSMVPQSFKAFSKKVASAPENQRAVLVDKFMASVHSFPLIQNDSVCTFLWRGVATRVYVAGDHTGWNPAAAPLTRLSTTNLWHRTVVFPPDARLDYKFVVDSSWVLDPGNSFTVEGGFGANSELRMPKWIPPKELEYHIAVPHGSLFDTTLASTILGMTRSLRVYIPAGYAAATDSFPVLYVHDGLDYLRFGRMDIVLDNLIAARSIRPLVVVFIPPVDRSAEYAGPQMERFSSFLRREVLPFIETRYRVLSRPQARGSLGASNGGNISLWLGAFHSDLFGLVAAQSSNVVDTVARSFRDGPKRDVRVYLDIGTFDVNILVPMVKNLQRTLETRGYDYRFQQIDEGHSWGNWRGHVDDVLRYFFAGKQ